MSVIIEPFGVDYRKVTQEECPYCRCCSLALCKRGRASVLECAGLTSVECKDTVTGCACSSATTDGTAAWREAMVAATRQAEHLPLPEAAEQLLRAVAAQSPAVADVPDPGGFIHALRLRQFIVGHEGVCQLTSLGRAYLAARNGERVATPVLVERVDAKANTASVIVTGWSTETPVTVLLDHLLQATELEPAELPGAFLEAVANVVAESAEDIVLTDIRPALKPLPRAWKAIPAAVRGDEEGGGD